MGIIFKVYTAGAFNRAFLQDISAVTCSHNSSKKIFSLSQPRCKLYGETNKKKDVTQMTS